VVVQDVLAELAGDASKVSVPDGCCVVSACSNAVYSSDVKSVAPTFSRGVVRREPVSISESLWAPALAAVRRFDAGGAAAELQRVSQAWQQDFEARLEAELCLAMTQHDQELACKEVELQRSVSACRGLDVQLETVLEELEAARMAERRNEALVQERLALGRQLHVERARVATLTSQCEEQARRHMDLCKENTLQMGESERVQQALRHDLDNLKQEFVENTESNRTLECKFNVTNARLQKRLTREKSDIEQKQMAEKKEQLVATKRVGEMHGGTYFEKLAFHKDKRERRFVRLTFDRQRVEWGTQERSLKKELSVASIVRIDYGDASRAYRACEFLSKDRPHAGRCLTITTASRTLDLIASSERDVESWVLGLNGVIAVHPERHHFTRRDFLGRQRMLHMEAPSQESLAAVRMQQTGRTSTTREPTSPSASDGGDDTEMRSNLSTASGVSTSMGSCQGSLLGSLSRSSETSSAAASNLSGGAAKRSLSNRIGSALRSSSRSSKPAFNCLRA